MWGEPPHLSLQPRGMFFREGVALELVGPDFLVKEGGVAGWPVIQRVGERGDDVPRQMHLHGPMLCLLDDVPTLPAQRKGRGPTLGTLGEQWTQQGQQGPLLIIGRMCVWVGGEGGERG